MCEWEFVGVAVSWGLAVCEGDAVWGISGVLELRCREMECGAVAT